MEYLTASLQASNAYNNTFVPASVGKNILNFSEDRDRLMKRCPLAERVQYLMAGGWLSRSISMCYVEGDRIMAGILFADTGEELILDRVYLRNEDVSDKLHYLFHEAVRKIIQYEKDFPPVIACEDPETVRIFKEEMSGALDPDPDGFEGVDAYASYIRLNSLRDALSEFGLQGELSFEPGFEPVLILKADEDTRAELVYHGIVAGDDTDVSSFELRCDLYEGDELIGTQTADDTYELDAEHVVNDVLLPFLFGGQDADLE